MRVCVACVTSVPLSVTTFQDAAVLTPNHSFFETLHTIFIIHMTYYYAINNFGDLPSIAGSIVWCVAPFCSGADSS